ncbi:MAG: hypothetical protein ABIL45_04165 [candidate division WOR-3 bacterium]
MKFIEFLKKYGEENLKGDKIAVIERLTLYTGDIEPYVVIGVEELDDMIIEGVFFEDIDDNLDLVSIKNFFEKKLREYVKDVGYLYWRGDEVSIEITDLGIRLVSDKSIPKFIVEEKKEFFDGYYNGYKRIWNFLKGGEK